MTKSVNYKLKYYTNTQLKILQIWGHKIFWGNKSRMPQRLHLFHEKTAKITIS